MNRKNIISGVFVILAVLGYYFFGESANPITSSPEQEVLIASEQAASFIVPDQTIYDLDGRVAYQGDIDLKPTLERIERGETDPHDNDGAVFGNREGLLPQRNRGYYREYVVRTASIKHAGPQRIIMGEGGEIYYTPDHYESFLRLNP